MRKLALIPAAIALAVGLLVPTAQAGTPFIPFTCQERLIVQTADSTCWVDEHGVLHCRGYAADYRITGSEYCAGIAHTTANFNLDLATGAGNLWGTNDYVLDAFDGGFRATWAGHWTNPFPLAPDATDIWVAKFVGHGYGDMAGWQVRGQGVERTHVLVDSTGRVWQSGDH